MSAVEQIQQAILQAEAGIKILRDLLGNQAPPAPQWVLVSAPPLIADSLPPSQPALLPSPPMAWGKRLSPAAKKFLFQTAKDFRIGSPDWLPSCIAFETEETFDPTIRPRRKDGSLISSAVGLIQWLSAVAESLGTSTDNLLKMSVEQQLVYVWLYYKKVMTEIGVTSIDSLEDCYMVIHWPAAVGKSNSTTLYSKGTAAYTANFGLDSDHNGVITKDEAGALVRAKLIKGLLPENAG